MSTRHIRLLTYSTIMIIEILLLIIAFQTAWECSSAPGGKRPPVSSQLGKQGSQTPGVSIISEKNFKTLCFSQNESQLKLILGLRQSCTHTHGWQILFGNSVVGNKLFNIILIIPHSAPIEYMAELSTIYQHHVDNLLISHLGKGLTLGRCSQSGTVHSAMRCRASVQNEQARVMSTMLVG
jgi:hypothetical protein